MSANEEIRAEDLVGTWKLISAHRTFLETGETIDQNPDNPPAGFLTYGNDGRMTAITLWAGGPNPSALRR